jgi:hypothetical protein
MHPQRCTDSREHGPHRVEACGTWTGFDCAGYDPAEFERQLTEAFGPE